MKFSDSEILLRREEKKKEKYNDLQNGYIVDGEVLYFAEKKVLDSFFILIPVLFEQMPDELAKIKYPIEFRPQQIYTRQNLRVNFCFSLFPDNIEEPDMRAVANRMIAAIRKENANCRIVAKRGLDEISGYWFSFQSPAMDGSLYHMMLIAKVDGRILHGTFNCPFEEMEQWRHLVLSVWKSIKTLKETEEKK